MQQQPNSAMLLQTLNVVVYSADRIIPYIVSGLAVFAAQQQDIDMQPAYAKPVLQNHRQRENACHDGL
ncbi:hypothetical protein D3C80_2023650 [compost metagenome]